jgi:hypothetical protein
MVAKRQQETFEPVTLGRIRRNFNNYTRITTQNRLSFAWTRGTDCSALILDFLSRMGHSSSGWPPSQNTISRPTRTHV